MGHYQRHIFFCTNVRDPDADRPCCSQSGSVGIRAYAKQRMKDLGMTGPGKVRVNTSGCLDRCEEGPVCVVYPEGVWYTYVDEFDVDEIIDSHLVGGTPVERLKI